MMDSQDESSGIKLYSTRLHDFSNGSDPNVFAHSSNCIMSGATIPPHSGCYSSWASGWSKTPTSVSANSLGISSKAASCSLLRKGKYCLDILLERWDIDSDVCGMWVFVRAGGIAGLIEVI